MSTALKSRVYVSLTIYPTVRVIVDWTKYRCAILKLRHLVF